MKKYFSVRIRQNKRSLDFTGKETTAQPNPSNDFTVTLSACWVKQDAYTYDYTGGEQTFAAPCNGYYKLEVWGAEGGVWDKNERGGFGGYSVGVQELSRSNIDYIYVGGAGTGGKDDTTGYGVLVSGGYNGGADGRTWVDSKTNGSGGGATHIATVSGLLKNLSGYRNTGGTNISKEILIVAGGGGGTGVFMTDPTTGDRSDCSNIAKCHGGDAGGYQGSIGIPIRGNSNRWYGTGGTQTAAGRYIAEDDLAAYNYVPGGFGFGEYCDSPYNNYHGNSSGGGGGWYGGGCGCGAGGYGGGGSGYIGSSNLISGGGITKHMTCYSCATSSTASTLTYSNTTTPTSTPTADVARTGNGYAKITYIAPTI